MGRSGVQAGKLRRLRLALLSVALLLPVFLCACRQNRSLVEDDSAYRVTPGRIRFDENLTYNEDLAVNRFLQEQIAAAQKQALADLKRLTDSLKQAGQ